MHKLTSPSWWLQMFMSTLMTMIFIYLIKKIANKVNVPVVNDIVQEV